MLLNNTEQTVPIPHEKDETLTVRRLSWREMQEATEIRQGVILKNMRELGGDILKALSSFEDQANSNQQTPGAKYDKDYVLNHGLVGWSYDAPVKDNIQHLDPETAEFAFNEIVRISEGGGVEKNG